MKVLFFGSRNLGWAHARAAKALARHAVLHLGPLDAPPLNDGSPQLPPLTLGLLHDLADGGYDDWVPFGHMPDERVMLIHGDGPPGKRPGAVGADKLSEFACMETWPSTGRRVRRYPPMPEPGEDWGTAAKRRNSVMVAHRPDRIYCIHTDLDASAGSRDTADKLLAAHLEFVYLQVKMSGELIEVSVRRAKT